MCAWAAVFLQVGLSVCKYKIGHLVNQQCSYVGIYMLHFASDDQVKCIFITCMHAELDAGCRISYRGGATSHTHTHAHMGAVGFVGHMHV